MELQYGSAGDEVPQILRRLLEMCSKFLVIFGIYSLSSLWWSETILFPAFLLEVDCPVSLVGAIV